MLSYRDSEVGLYRKLHRLILQDETLRDVHHTFYYGQAPAKPQGRDVAAQVASLKHPGDARPGGLNRKRQRTGNDFTTKV